MITVVPHSILTAVYHHARVSLRSVALLSAAPTPGSSRTLSGDSYGAVKSDQ
jgi:hypothetical protein